MTAAHGLSGPSGDRTKARALAVVMHVAFIALLVFGVSWPKKPEMPVTADLWSSLPQMPQPQPEVAVAPVPPEPKPAPKVTPPPVPKTEPAPVPKPDIALRDKEKKHTEPKATPKPEPRVEPKPEPKKREDDTAKRERERERERKLAEAETEAKAAAEKAARDKASVAERAAKAAAAARENQKYINGIRGKVYARVALPPDLQGNPETEFSVSLLPGGELLEVVLRKSSGNAAYDAAVEKAIRQAQPFEVPSGELFQQYFRQFPMVFRPR